MLCATLFQVYNMLCLVFTSTLGTVLNVSLQLLAACYLDKELPWPNNCGNTYIHITKECVLYSVGWLPR